MKRNFTPLAALLLCAALTGYGPGQAPPPPVSPPAAVPLNPQDTPGPETKRLPSKPSAQPLPPMEGLGNAPLNIFNEGYAVAGGGAIYYADRQNGGNLWRADPDGGNARMLDEGSFRFLNFSGGQLFFADWDAVYAMSPDGGPPRVVKACQASSLCALDEWLYYIQDYSIRRMRADGSGDSLLAQDVSGHFVIEGDWLYYLRDAEGEVYRRLWRTALDGSETARVSDAPIQSFLIHEGSVFYVDWETAPYGLRRMAPDGAGFQEIYDRNVALCTASEDWIYLTSKPYRDAVNGLYRLKPDGSGLALVTEGHCFGISAAGDWLFFCTNDEEYRITKMRPDGSERGFVNE